MKTTEKVKVIYREPGGGSIEFTKRFTEGLTLQQATQVITDMLKGELHVSEDKRIKRCDYCGYYWRDDSLRNTKRTCSDDCKTGYKTLQRRQQRADKELMNPTPKPNKHRLIDDYLYWLEDPFWLHEYSMIKIGWKFERPSGVALMDVISARNEVYGEGNRQKSKHIVDYHGDKRDEF